MAKVSPHPVSDVIRSILEFWRKGKECLDRTPLRRLDKPETAELPRKWPTLWAEAERTGTNAEFLAKARQAAEEYTKAEIEHLCKRIEKHRCRFGPSHVRRLLAVKDRELRAFLTTQALAHRWSVKELAQVIKAQRDRRPSVGRRPQVADDPAMVLVRLEDLCLSWTRWTQKAEARLPRRLRGPVALADSHVREVREEVVKELRRLRSRKTK